jgi:ribitol-5-phosphate 2-dehydrogenase (NADP+)
MKNIQYKLIKPFFIKKIETEMILNKNKILIKPYLVSVCKSDLRYYSGNRDKIILKLKLPLILLHEGIGVVMKSKMGFNKGEKVIVIPQMGEEKNNPNYNHKELFLSSNCDGLLQKYIQLPKENIIKIPDYIDEKQAVIVELISVACHAIFKIKIEGNSKIAILGDGPLGKIVYYTLKTLKKKVYLFGKNDKISLKFDVFFECVGGINSEQAISTALNNLIPYGKLILLGVSEDKILINTRFVIDKGIQIIGSNRSTRKNFIFALNLLKYKKFRSDIDKVIYKKIIEINSLNDINNHFNFLLNKKLKKKQVLSLKF